MKRIVLMGLFISLLGLGGCARHNQSLGDILIPDTETIFDMILEDIAD